MSQAIQRVVVRGNRAFVMGTPDDVEDGHNCDAMGCCSVGSHVLAWVPVKFLPAGNSTTFYAEVNERVNKEAAEASLLATVSTQETK